MANILSLNTYAINGSDIVGGKTIGLVVAQIGTIMPAPANTSMGGVTILTLVTYKSNELGLVNDTYYSPTATATVISNAG